MLLAHCNTLRSLNLIHPVNKKFKRKTNKSQKRLPRDLIDNFIVCIAEEMVLQHKDNKSRQGKYFNPTGSPFYTWLYGR